MLSSARLYPPTMFPALFLLLLTCSCIFFLSLAAQELAPAPSPEPQCLPSEKVVLLTFKSSIPNFNRSLDWDPDRDCCSWQGVTCERRTASPRRVVELNLPSLHLTAGIPTVLGNLTFLRILNLSGNHFRGSIPSEFASLVDLQTLDLSGNNLSGIPSEFASLVDLQTLDLSGNNLSGPVSLFDTLSSLQRVNISGNQFSGSLPTYRNLTSLEMFDASMNSLSGAFRTDVCQHASQLRLLNLSSNKLAGSFGDGLRLCTRLRVMDLSSNSLWGALPDDLYNITSLQILRLADNKFTGPLKDIISSLTNLTQLVLCGNNLTGVLPKSLSLNSKLTVLSLGENRFYGSIDMDFTNMTNLEELNLNSNSFAERIPASLGNCTSLRNLNLARNQLTGEIPHQFNMLKNLMMVSFSTNHLNGGLLSLEKCENLVSLVLTKNVFTEPLPSTVNGFLNLQVLALGFLNLTGTIPTWLQNCTKLQILDLSWNHFEGKLPDWLGNFQHLIYLDLSNNSLTGMIPSQLFTLESLMHNTTNMTGLQNIRNTLSVKRENDSPDLMYNRPVAFPPSLIVSNNNLRGDIPSEVGHLKLLVGLDLSYNHLTGSIPETLANVTGLEFLDLSNNDLYGSIPSSLAKLTFLAVFNVSYNHLSGPIPLGNQFETFPNTSYAGDSGLCGYPILASCQRDRTNNASATVLYARRGTRTITLLVSVCIGLGVPILLVAVCFCLYSGRTAVHQGLDNSREMGSPESLSGAHNLSVELFHNHQKLTVGDLFKATNNFDSANIIGCGGFGLVYRAELADGSPLAIKKLTGDCGQMEREFRAEVDALSKAQHKNLVPLQGCAQIGNDKFLIYSYMENGSLDYWLHEQSDGGAYLEWPIRLKIAQGAAAGLAYLHQICNPHIVHRDIKSSNILLDEQFEAHLADFGLARLMISTDTHVTTELVGTLGYIPPEYGGALNATPRGDVYSFGVVLLELLTGKRPVDVCKPRGSGDLVAWVQQMRQCSKQDQIFDNLLQWKSYEEQMRQVLDVACSCINQNPLNRPVIKDIVFRLDVVGQDKHLTT